MSTLSMKYVYAKLAKDNNRIGLLSTCSDCTDNSSSTHRWALSFDIDFLSAKDTNKEIDWKSFNSNSDKFKLENLKTLLFETTVHLTKNEKEYLNAAFNNLKNL